LLAELIARTNLVSEAARGLRAVPRPKWPAAKAASTATSLVAWARTIPPADRNSQDYGETVQLAADLAAYLPANQAESLRRELKQLRVPFFVIRTVREQMRYDTPRLVVEAGKPFEILFINDDFMSHNLVVVKPDTREKVGTTAAAMKPDQLDGSGRAFMPALPEILGGTRMLLTGQQQSLKLTAPNAEGTYEYVCTFPGHHQVMWGRLMVTRDVDAWLNANPGPVQPVPVPTTDGSEPATGHDHAHQR
jgi:azurin